MNSIQQTGTDAVTQLDEARKLALGDAAYYPQIVPGVLPIIGPTATLDLRRWGADFLAETFASPSLGADQKQQLSLKVLQTLKDFLEIPGEDTGIVKSVVQATTSIYPLVFKHIIYNPSDSATWEKMASIKSNILRRMDLAPAGVKVCCIKFIQRIVLVQTPGLIADPRRPDQNEVSLALVPRDHPLIPPPNLEAEALGLCDRLLTVFEDTPSDALLVTATLNSVGLLVRTRASIAHRILNAILNFNPFKVLDTVVTPRVKVSVKSMERTTRAFLVNLNKRNPSHPLAGRVQGYLERMHQIQAEFFDNGSRKRPAPSEPTDGLDPAKRQRLGAEVPDTPPQSTAEPHLQPGPVSMAQLFTLTQDSAPRSFDAQAIPFDLLNKIIVPILTAIDPAQLDNAVNAIRARYLSLSQHPASSAFDAARQATGAALDVEDDEYDPSEDAEQLYNRLDSAPSALTQVPHVPLGPYTVPQPPPLTNDEVNHYGKGTVLRVFGMVDGLVEAYSRSTKSGFNRLAANNQDRDSWVTVVARLATRPLAGLETANSLIKKEGDTYRRQTFSITNSIREALHKYVLDDFRKRIDAAITWLNEEWYNEQLQLRAGTDPILNYDRLALNLLDGIAYKLDAKDKVLIRFLSEIPSINLDILERVKRLADDPERVSLVITTIHYLALFRPPVRTMCIDALEDLWRNNKDAKAATAKFLKKWRPEVLEPASKPQIQESSIPPHAEVV